MFRLNFKKDWLLNKTLFISFFSISFGLFSFTFISYLLLKYLTLSKSVEGIIWGLWSGVSLFVTLTSAVFPIILIFLVLKNDLGKNRIHYTVFTPQSILSWYLPKLVYCLIVQVIFSVITLTITYLQLDLMNLEIFDSFTKKLLTFCDSAFALGLIGIITLAMALYYSFRNNKTAWVLIVMSIMGYFLIAAVPTIVIVLKEGEEALNNPDAKYILMTWLLDVLPGAAYIGIALYFFDRKIEY